MICIMRSLSVDHSMVALGKILIFQREFVRNGFWFSYGSGDIACSLRNCNLKEASNRLSHLLSEKFFKMIDFIHRSELMTIVGVV